MRQQTQQQQTTTIATVLDTLRDERRQMNVSIVDARYNVRVYEVQTFCDALRNDDAATRAFFADSFNDRLSDRELAATLDSDTRAALAQSARLIYSDDMQTRDDYAAAAILNAAERAARVSVVETQINDMLRKARHSAQIARIRRDVAQIV